MRIFPDYRLGIFTPESKKRALKSARRGRKTSGRGVRRVLPRHGRGRRRRRSRVAGYRLRRGLRLRVQESRPQEIVSRKPRKRDAAVCAILRGQLLPSRWSGQPFSPLRMTLKGSHVISHAHSPLSGEPKVFGKWGALAKNVVFARAAKLLKTLRQKCHFATRNSIIIHLVSP